MRARDWLALGVSVIPLGARSKTPVIATWREFQRRLPSDAELDRWLHPARHYNLAVVTGTGDQGCLTAIDFDTLAEYKRWRSWALMGMVLAGDVARSTLKSRTARGMHVFVFSRQPVRCGHFDGGDIKGIGGYVAVEPSIHPSGHAYAYLDPAAPILAVDTLADVLPDPPNIAVAATPIVANAVHTSSSLWPQTLIDRIKGTIGPLDLITADRVYSQRWAVARCPFHDDGKPSLKIDREHGVVTCFTKGCVGTLDVIKLYERLHGVGTKEAVHALAAML